MKFFDFALNTDLYIFTSERSVCIFTSEMYYIYFNISFEFKNEFIN